jgi:hypothetical protein
VPSHFHDSPVFRRACLSDASSTIPLLANKSEVGVMASAGE